MRLLVSQKHTMSNFLKGESKYPFLTKWGFIILDIALLKTSFSQLHLKWRSPDYILAIYLATFWVLLAKNWLFFLYIHFYIFSTFRYFSYFTHGIFLPNGYITTVSHMALLKELTLSCRRCMARIIIDRIMNVQWVSGFPEGSNDALKIRRVEKGRSQRRGCWWKWAIKGYFLHLGRAVVQLQS